MLDKLPQPLLDTLALVPEIKWVYTDSGRYCSKCGKNNWDEFCIETMICNTCYRIVSTGCSEDFL